LRGRAARLVNGTPRQSSSALPSADGGRAFLRKALDINVTNSLLEKPPIAKTRGAALTK
jgi:hypothetical protein